MEGFLLYVTRTYRQLSPYLKGLHLTIDGWHSRLRRLETTDPDVLLELAGLGKGPDLAMQDAGPEYVEAVPSLLRADVDMLKQLTETLEPPLVSVRCKKTACVETHLERLLDPPFRWGIRLPTDMDNGAHIF